jgi:hypothetical protein
MGRFKVGDRVRVLPKHVNNHLKLNVVYVVEAVKNPYGYFEGLDLQNVPKFSKDQGWHECRFELVSSANEFNISTATDEELAAEYRRLTDERVACSIALRDRGYNLSRKDSGASLIVIQSDNINIVKRPEPIYL